MDENKDAIIEQQWRIIVDQQKTISQQRIELAHHRQREHSIDDARWGFALWLLLHDVWPFTLWYGRHER